MKAAVLRGPKNLSIEDVQQPIPKYGEILVRVKATAICGTDIAIFEGRPKVDYPRILGHESAGEIVELGEGVKNLKVGDKVVMNPTSYCGICLDCMRGDTNICKNGGLFGREFDGTYAEYVTLSENGADHVFNEDVVQRVYELTKDRGVDYVIECVGKSVTMNMATELVRPGGTILAFGINSQGIENFNSYSLYYKDLKIVGSRAMQPIDWPTSIDLAKKGKIDIGTIITHKLPLKDLTKGFEMLKDSSLKALRIVIEI